MWEYHHPLRESDLKPLTLRSRISRRCSSTTSLRDIIYDYDYFASKRKVVIPYADHDIAVFWDIEDCKIPRGKSLATVVDNIKMAIRNVGYVSTCISIMAYGLTDERKTEFETAGIKPIHIEDDGAIASKISLGLWNWVIDHRYEETNILIIGNNSRSFTFNILLSVPSGVTGLLISAGRIVWDWPILADGGAPFSEDDKIAYALMRVELF